MTISEKVVSNTHPRKRGRFNRTFRVTSQQKKTLAPQNVKEPAIDPLSKDSSGQSQSGWYRYLRIEFLIITVYKAAPLNCWTHLLLNDSPPLL